MLELYELKVYTSNGRGKKIVQQPVGYLSMCRGLRQLYKSGRQTFYFSNRRYETDEFAGKTFGFEAVDPHPSRSALVPVGGIYLSGREAYHLFFRTGGRKSQENNAGGNDDHPGGYLYAESL